MNRFVRDVIVPKATIGFAEVLNFYRDVAGFRISAVDERNTVGALVDPTRANIWPSHVRGDEF